jgi:RNA polymerase sigma factor (sigma-70 family)
MGHMTAVIDEIPDGVIIDRILKGEKNLFELIIRRYNQRLYRIGMSMLNDDAEAEDAMQSSYISAYEHLPGFENRAAFATWLTRIMLNECLGRKKAKQRLKALVENQPEKNKYMEAPDQVLVNRELRSVLENAVAQLPEKYRLVFVLREMEDLSVKETSDTLRIGEPNVKVRLSRAKIMLRENLQGYMKNQVYHFHLTRCDAMAAVVLKRLNLA